MKRKICVITGSRAEYGILKPLLEEIYKDSGLVLQLIVTGMHLSPEFGLTYHEIEDDGFKINEKIETILSSDTPIGISKSMGLTLISFAEAYARLTPEIIVVLGDRFEIFSAVSAALISRIPVAHIGGGELTEGAFDNALRHSITKMSHLHFAATEEYKKRIIQLGENPNRVFNVGEIGLDSISKFRLLSKKTLEESLGFHFNKRNLLITFHPVTLENNSSREQFTNILSILDKLEDTTLIFTKTNADTHGRIINKLIDDYVVSNPHKSLAFSSLGRQKYLSMLQFVDACIGNSSSGIVEAPLFKIATINIGDRQKGRIKPSSVIDCEPQPADIKKALQKVYSKAFRKNLHKIENPYFKENSVFNVKNILKNYDLSNIIKKSFYDMKIY